MAEPAKTRHEEVQARFLAQQEARLQQRKESRARNEEGRAPEESVGKFWDDVRSTLEAVEDALSRMRIEAEGRKPEPDATQEAILKQLAQAKALQKRLTDATIFLPPYDVRRAQEEIDNLMAKIEQTRTALAPRKKFSFASKRKTATKSNEGEAPRESAAPEPPSVKAPPAGPAAAVGAAAPPPPAESAMEGFMCRTGEVLDLSRSLGPRSGPRDVLLKDLTACTVHMLEALAFVRLENLRDCRVMCGPVAGPVYVESCHGCTLVLASRQLRIHNTASTDFYVHVVSGPIIEDCKAVRFAPYCLHYPALAAHFRETELAGTASAWSDVKDFKWLRAQQSPHWSVLPEAERIGKVELGGGDAGGGPAAEEGRSQEEEEEEL